ncbi:hypothetical protein ACFWIQ_09530 [Kitasatospora sp. NPDC127059]|uniref:hypothetical protein n=1 Tax=unclassified Kitasatospora TaxID=2633591 RepID=UPI003648B28E
MTAHLAPALGGQSRPKQYCSRSCRSKVDRVKAKIREAAAARVVAPSAPQPGPDAAPGPTAAPGTPAAPVAAVPVDAVLARWGEDGHHLLGIADALHRRLTRFLEKTADGDPAEAFAELAHVLPAYGTRAYMAAQDIRDKARWPDLTQHERVVARSCERIDRWNEGGAQGDDQAVVEDDRFASRGETPAAPPTALATEAAAATGPETEKEPIWRSAAEAAERARRTACTDPETRFDFPDFLHDLEITFGPCWELGSWHTPDAQGVLQLRHHSTPIGWTAPLPDGPWGQAGWIALLYQPRGTAKLLSDNFSRPKTHPSTDLALDAVLRAHQANKPASGR